MLDHEDLKWIVTTSTDLNAMLQQIARYSDLARQHKGEYNYIDLLHGRIELASKTAQALFDRVTERIVASTSGSSVDPSQSPSFTVVPSLEHDSTTSTKAAVSVVSKSGEPKAEPATSHGGSSIVSEEIKVLNPGGNKEFILVVDDEAEIAELASEMLAEEGYKVIVAPDGFEALRIYQKMGKQIGLVILDFFLPVMDGDAVFDELRALNPDINVVLSSGFAEQNKLGAMLALGLRGFIPKPYTREKLLAQVRSTLDAGPQASH
ncbi:MAG: response regulator [Verrucomicrobiota bacterium]